VWAIWAVAGGQPWWGAGYTNPAGLSAPRMSAQDLLHAVMGDLHVHPFFCGHFPQFGPQLSFIGCNL